MLHILEEIRKLSAELLPEITGIRRHLHAHPELSGQEFRTAEFISQKLNDWSIPHRTGVGGTGIIATLEGAVPGGPTIALRADMDALPIHEENDIPYKSANPGVMHACGHDVHMACLLGAARIISKFLPELKGNARLIFQPSEEKYPGGAIAMIKEGVLEDPVPEFIIGQHVYPELDSGSIGLRAGNYMAATDEIFITVKGKGGHAATPHQLVDPVLIASHIVVALQQIVSRNAVPTQPTVISFGRMIADGRTNVIPDTARLEGIMRTFDESWREELKERITGMATGIARSMGGDAEVFIDRGYPALYNHPQLSEKIRQTAEEYLGEGRVSGLEMRMTAEDFAYYAQKIPACFYRLGIRNEAAGINSNLHTSTFDADERSIETGMGLMAWITVNNLSTAY